jgi:hypothetical protein
MGLNLRDAIESAWQYFVATDDAENALREPGEPFKAGHTLLAIARDGDGFVARVVNVPPRQTVHSLLSNLLIGGKHFGLAVLLIDINAIEARIDAALDAVAEHGD